MYIEGIIMGKEGMKIKNKKNDVTCLQMVLKNKKWRGMLIDGITDEINLSVKSIHKFIGSI